MSIFDKAKVVVEKPKGKAKSKAVEVQISGLRRLAMIDTVLKSLTAIKLTIADDVKETIRGVFVEGSERKRPENFRGVDGENVSASCELRSRSTASPLTDDECAMFDNLGVPYETIVEKEDTFIINPAYFTDSAMLEAVGKALEKVKGLPEDFIMKQVAVSKRVVTAESIDTIFEKGIAASLIDMATVIAIKPKFEGEFEDAMEEVGAFLQKDKEKAAASQGKE